MKIGIFAGTFDPVHSGHIEFATKAVALGPLDKVIIVAEKNPYRKEPFASWDYRQSMIERATEDIDEADHDYEFSNQLAHQHTMQNMLVSARKHYGEDNEFWFLVGSDIFEHMKRWQDMVGQEEYGGFVVMLRDDHTRQWLDEKIDELKQAGKNIDIVLIDNDRPHISSRRIRDAISGGETPDQLDEKVTQYIEEHQLYGAV